MATPLCLFLSRLLYFFNPQHHFSLMIIIIDVLEYIFKNILEVVPHAQPTRM